MSNLNTQEGKHFVLVHGACHGAWSWYKVKPLLEKAGHQVTAPDMAASGVHLAKLHHLNNLKDYSQPLIQLMASLPDDRKVILVGHSLGGLNLAVIMDLFPHKIEAAVFLSAFLPDTQHNPSFVLDQYNAKVPEGGWLDTEFKTSGNITELVFGPKFLALLYHLSPIEDFELAMALKRPASFFLHDLQNAENFSEEKWGKIRKVYVVCEEDKAIPQEFQRWMAKNAGVDEVKELPGSDHMPMFSIPQRLTDCLSEIAHKH